jgi:hypothetical protein
MDVRIKITWGLLASTFIACVCVIVFQCRPFHKNWQINPNPGSKSESLSLIMVAQRAELTDSFIRCLSTGVLVLASVFHHGSEYCNRFVAHGDSHSGMASISATMRKGIN